MINLSDTFYALVWGRRIAFAGITIAVLFVVALIVRSCDGCEGCKPNPSPVTQVDASVQLARIDRRVDAAVQHAEEQLQQIEQQHRDAIDSFNANEQREYEEIRAQGPKAVEAWINDWYAEQRRGSP